MPISILASEEPNKFFLPGDINEFYWGLAAFLVVFSLLAWKVFPLFGKLLKARADKVEEQLAAADRAHAEANAQLAALRSRLGDADGEAARIVSDAHTTAARLTDELKVKAASDVAAMKERAAADIESAKAKAQSDLGAEVNAAALTTAEELVRGNLDEATQVALIERYIEQVGAS